MKSNVNLVEEDWIVILVDDVFNGAAVKPVLGGHAESKPYVEVFR